MKKFLFGIFFLPAVLFAKGDYHYYPMVDFSGGLNSYDSSIQIANNEVKDAQDVYFDKRGVVQKRNGFTVYGTTGTAAFNNSIAYTDASSNNWLIVIATDGIHASNSNGIFSVLIATVPAFQTSVVGAVNAFGKVYFVDSIQGLYSWDGTTTRYVAGSPKGSIITQFHNRLWVSGLPIPNQNHLYSSEYLNGENWLVSAASATQPVDLQVGLNDNFNAITGLYAGYNDTLYVLKQLSVNALYGFDQSDFQIRILTQDAGCVDGQSIQPFYGNLVWLSGRGVELFDGVTCTLISKKIKDRVIAATSSSFNSKFNLQDLPTDWAAATNNTAAYIDTNTISGNLQMTFPDLFTSFRDGGNGSKKVWTSYCSSPFGSCIASTAVASGGFTMTSSSSSDGQAIVSQAQVLGSVGTTFYLVISSITQAVQPSIDGHDNFLSLVLSPAGTTNTDPRTISTSSLWFQFKSTTTGMFFLDEVVAGTLASPTLVCGSGFASGSPCAGDVPMLTPIFMYVNGSNYSVSVGTLPYKAGSQPVGAVNPFMYIDFHADGITAGSKYTSNAVISAFGLAPVSASVSSYIRPLATSQLITVGSAITSWGPVTISDTHTGGTLLYQFGSTTTASVGSISNFISVVNGQIPTVPTNPFAAFTASFTVTNASGSLALSSFMTNWNIGTRRSRAASVYFDDRYYLSIGTSTNDTYNTATLVLAKNDAGSLAWTSWNLQAGTWVVYQNKLYHGNSISNGKVYLDNQGFNDDGAAINGYFITKDYGLDSTVQNDVGVSLYEQAEGLGAYTLSSSYFMDKDPTEYPLSDVTQNEQGNFLNIKLPFPYDSTHQNFGRLFSFKFYNDIIDQPMRVIGGVLEYIQRPLTSE